MPGIEACLHWGTKKQDHESKRRNSACRNTVDLWGTRQDRPSRTSHPFSAPELADVFANDSDLATTGNSWIVPRDKANRTSTNGGLRIREAVYSCAGADVLVISYLGTRTRVNRHRRVSRMCHELDPGTTCRARPLIYVVDPRIRVLFSRNDGVLLRLAFSKLVLRGVRMDRRWR